MAIHAAAPCPRAVKEQMLEWWGPILHEYYGGTEPSGLTYCDPYEWQAHPGTVGRAVTGIIHVCDETGNELPTGTVGSIFFEQKQTAFTYHGPPELSASSRHQAHDTWTTLGDVGWVDEEGYLYLSDRASFMIISGGVNIYPQETEDCLVVHPDVEDAAVIGVPNADLGEEVKAIVQLRPGIEPSGATAGELIEWCKARIAHFKCPRSVDFVEALPRLPTGKLYKRQLKDQYWGERESRIV
jgi:fatty-acyl-CoA synthase